MDEPSPVQPWWRRWFGRRSEHAAARYLERRGYRVVARNWTCSLGELDLVAVDRDVIVFVEVRSTGRADPEPPAVSVDRKKQKRLTDLALAYLQEKRLLGHSARFDVLAVSWPETSREPRIVHYPDAFEATGDFQMFS